MLMSEKCKPRLLFYVSKHRHQYGYNDSKAKVPMFLQSLPKSQLSLPAFTNRMSGGNQAL